MRKIYAFLMVLCFAPMVEAMQVDEELAYRVRFSSENDVKLLLDKGADPNSFNQTGLPMVSVAASRKDNDAVPVLKMLYENGGDVNVGGANNQYPIIIAARDNNPRMVQYLLDHTDVDVTVRDLNGLLPVEIAEYYGSNLVIGMINALTQKRLRAEQKRTSPERRDDLIDKLARHYCEHQYMYYYHKSGQSRKSKDEIDTIIGDYRTKGQAQIEELYKTFQFPYETAFMMKSSIGGPLSKELNDMISNRERARQGVGTEEDLKERCDRISGNWMDGFREQEAAERELDEYLN